MKAFTTLVLLALVASAVSLCRHPEDADSSCTSDCDCCGGAVCRPGPADINGECGLFCCHDSGSVATDSELCCNPCGTTEICDCGIWACAPWGKTGFSNAGGRSKGAKNKNTRRVNKSGVEPKHNKAHNPGTRGRRTDSHSEH